MSQKQPERPQEVQGHDKEPIKYGDVFPVSSELAEKPVAPQDAAMMQVAETTVFGQTRKGGTAAAMQAAATINERAGLVSHEDLTVTGDQGVSVTATELPGARVVTETIAGQVVGEYVEATPVDGGVGYVHHQGVITIGEALEATARTAGNKAVEQSDAAAIQAAEVRATGSNLLIPGGLAAQAQSAATLNTSTREEDKVRLSEVLTVVGEYVEATPVDGGVGDVHHQGVITIGEALEATARTAGNKAVEQSDAAAIQAAEVRATGSNLLIPGGLAAQAQSAATLNTSTREEDKVRLSEVLTDATVKLPADKAATREDAEGVFSAERRNNPNLTAHPAGVAASIAAAANLNEKGQVI